MGREIEGERNKEQRHKSSASNNVFERFSKGEFNLPL